MPDRNLCFNIYILVKERIEAKWLNSTVAEFGMNE